MTRSEAIAFLTARHAAMTVRYPVGMREVSLKLYIRRNLRGAMRLTTDDARELREATR